MSAVYDVGFDENGDLPAFTRHITGADLVEQRIQVRLGTFLGEWILDQHAGLPFVDWRASKPPDVDSINAVIQTEIEDTPGVLRVDELVTTFDASSHTVSTVGRVIVDDESATEIPVTITTLRRSNHMPALIFFGRPGPVMGA